LPDAAGREESASRSDANAAAQGFPRALRLTSRRQFDAIYAAGRRASCRCFTVYALPNALDHSRLGLTVTRKVGGAVVRNRVKRRLREAFRRNRSRLPGSLDLVINGRAAVLECTASEIERDLIDCVRRLSRRGER
jgi:ribonuclease P protein component